ncbi:MAG: kelch repeat-containing protein [bacterium]
MNRIIYVVLLLFFTSCSMYEPQEEEVAAVDFELGITLASASSVVVGDTLYIAFGRDEDGVYSDKFYKAHIDNIDQLGAFDIPFEARVNGVMQAVGSKIYMGLGYNDGGVYKPDSYCNDWWQYDCNTGVWSELAMYEDTETNSAVAWATDTAIYVTMGYQHYFDSRVFRYSIAQDEWCFVAQGGEVTNRMIATGATAQGRFFAGGGFNAKMVDDWCEFDIETNKWYYRTSPSTSARLFASAIGLGNYIYMLGGRYWGGTLTTQYFYENIIRYDVSGDSWSSLGKMPQGSCENMIIFTYENALYWGLGEQEDGSFVTKVYKLEL